MAQEKSFKTIGWLVLAIGLLGPVVVAGENSPEGEDQPLNVCTTPTPRTAEVWVQRHEELNMRVQEKPVDLIFIGDSITHRWESAGASVWQEYYGERNAVNLGIDGDGTQTILWRLAHGNIEGISPKVAVVMIGTNNSTDPRQTPEMIGGAIVNIVAALRENLPTTKVLVLKIFPRGQEVTDERRRGARASEIASAVADGQWVHYLDIGEAFVEPDGTIDPQVMPDFLHLSQEGYRRWASAMEPALQGLLDETYNDEQ